ncbi:MAG: N-acetylglucosamine-6-phosphate deacetylase [Terriglobales bacterium]
MQQAIYARLMVTPTETVERAAVLIEDGVIRAAGHREAIAIPADASCRDYGDAVLAPGLVDVHVHGGAGVDLMSAGAGEVATLRRHLARHGVTSFLATTISAEWDELMGALERLASAGLDIHMEGPFLSKERRGVHPPETLREPSPAYLDEICGRSNGRVRLITIAPELDGAEAFILEATRRGIRVSLGHSDANAEQARRAIQAGACHVTHTFNAMRPLHQREPGLLGVALTEAGLSAEIIADGIHVDPALVKLFLRCKAPESAVLASDGISAAGMGDGNFHLGTVNVRVEGGACWCGSTLAGSVLTLDRAVKNVRACTGCSWDAAVRPASQNPATLMKWARKGRLEAGMDADIAVFSPGGEITASYVGGKLVN